MTTRRARFELLDAFRGLAALAVLGYHIVDTLVPQGTNLVSDVLWLGWAGVYLFFPISGYCVLAASHAGGVTPAGFLKRRWTRIFPTYWASVFVVVILTLALAHWSRGSARDLWTLGWGWLPVLTLTQTWFGLSGAVSPVYWSLCYEEQFYLVVAATIVAPVSARRWILLGLTAVVAVGSVGGLLPYLPAGLFVDRWLCFAGGLAVFGWYDSRYGRRWAGAMLALVATGIWVSPPMELPVALAASLFFVAVRPVDARVSHWPGVRWLGTVGVFSYSLYLTHVPVAGRVVNLSKRLGWSLDMWPTVALLAAGLSLACAKIFFVVVERRYMRAPLPLPSAAPCEPSRAGVIA